MAIAAYMLGACGLDTGTFAPFGGVSQSGWEAGERRVIETADGTLDPTYMATGQLDPSLPITTTDLGAVLALNSSKFLFKGVAMSASNKLQTYYRQLQNADEPWADSASKHLKLEVLAGLLAPRSFQAAQGSAASITLQPIPTWDGTNDAVTVTADQALPTLAAVDEEYTVGPVTLNAVAMDEEVQGIRCDPGIRPAVIHGGGREWARFAGIVARNTVFTITSANAARLSTFSTTGTALANGTIYLRRLQHADVPYPDASTVHVKITLYDVGTIRVPALSAGRNTPIQSSIIVDLGRPTGDPNEIMAVETGVAIT